MSFKVGTFAGLSGLLLVNACGLGSISRFYSAELVPRSLLIDTVSILTAAEAITKVSVEFAFFPMAHIVSYSEHQLNTRLSGFPIVCTTSFPYFTNMYNICKSFYFNVPLIKFQIQIWLLDYQAACKKCVNCKLEFTDWWELNIIFCNSDCIIGFCNVVFLPGNKRQTS